MADLKIGKIQHWHTLSTILATFKLTPAPGEPFPDYQPGQYIALRRDDCRLTKRVAGADGRPRYVTMVDDAGKEKRGAVTHSYSILSAPFETRERGYLEFYVVLETDEEGQLGRLTESLFKRTGESGDLTYVNRIVGDFTLPKRASGFTNVCWVGTGTGLAPFMSMVRQLDYDAAHGAPADGVRYTLVHTNRTFEELAYHEELQAIEAAQRFDFVYVASVSRPTARDLADPNVGSGRANNLLRHMLDMPSREQQDLDEARAKGEDDTRLKAAVDRATPAALAKRLSLNDVRRRLEPGKSVILTCGNPSLMDDVKHIAEKNQIHFEKEDW